jgi:multiple sugar transport system permease protein/putative aldouronate transport system permease protein
MSFAKNTAGFFSNKKKRYSLKLLLLVFPFLLIPLIFSYYPLYGWIYAFYDYRPPRPLSHCDFVSFQWFITLFENDTKRKIIFDVMKNTFAMSGLGILFSWLPMVFAIFLSELRSKWFKRSVQTLTTLPNFISWILVYSLAFSLFSSSGMMNNLLKSLGLIDNPILFLQDNTHTWFTMWLWGTWKGLGWGAILYLAAIAGIDQELYEAAKVDGAGRFRLIWHITVPGLLPTYFVLLLLSIANFMNNGMEQYYVFQNAFNQDKIQVLDLYVYNLGMGSGSYSLATAISIMKSIVSVTLLFAVNSMSKAFRGETII